MESFGAVLQKGREAKNIDIETVARETSISKQYIEALEAEHTNVFPGETYLIGFLRNYSEYLGLDSQHIISLYRAKKIQEAPIPEGLLSKDKPAFLIPLIVILIILLLGAGGFCLYWFVFRIDPNTINDNVVLDSSQSVNAYQLTTEPLQKRIYKGDIIEVPLETGFYQLTVLDTIAVLSLETPTGTQYIELGEELELDIDNNPGSDIIIFLSDISIDDAMRGAEVRMLIKSSVVATSYTPVDISSIPQETVTASSKQVVILQDTRAYPFTITATFRGNCLFRYKSDSKDAVEDYFTSGDSLTLQASNGARFWMSNANAVKIQVIANTRTHDLEVGKAGQVLVEDVKWIRDTDGKYKLVVNELD